MYHSDQLGCLLSEPKPQARPALTSAKKVMIIDDNAFFARCLASLIDHEGDMKVCCLESSGSLLGRKLSKFRPDLIVMDICLGRENGLELARRLRTQKINTPILLASSLVRPSSGELEQIGRCRFIGKDQRPGELIRQLRSCLAA